MKKSALFTTTLFLSLVALAPSALAKTNRNAYVANNLDGTVDVIDIKTGVITATIPGFSHPFALAVSPNGRLLYVRETGNANLRVVDTDTNTITATINVGVDVGNEGAGPLMAFSRHGERAFVANSLLSELVVIDTKTSTVAATLPLPGFRPVAVAVSPDGDNVYLGSEFGGGIDVIDADPDALTVTATIAPGHLIGDLVLSTDGERLYAADNSGLVGNTSGILVIDTDKNTVEATIALPFTLPTFLFGMAVSPDGRHLYATEFFIGTRSSTITVIDTKDNSIDTTIPFNHQTLVGLAFSENGEKLLALNEVISLTVDSTLDVIDAETNTVDPSITVGRGADGLATQPKSSHHGDHDREDNHSDHDR